VTYNRSVPPSASVVITSYNRSQLLPRAIESAQCAGKNLEVIVVDDCSSDDTPEVCAQIPDIRDGARTADHYDQCRRLTRSAYA
jgi:glycosyltransferase involved in cell wall biosynthesis